MTRGERCAIYVLLFIAIGMLIVSSVQLCDADARVCARDSVIAEQRGTIRDLMGMIPQRGYYTPDSAGGR